MNKGSAYQTSRRALTAEGKLCGFPARAVQWLSGVGSGSTDHGTISSRSSHAMTSCSGMPPRQVRQNDSRSRVRPHCGKRLRKKKAKVALRASSQFHQRRAVCRSTPHRRLAWCNEPAPSKHSSTSCCTAQSYQRRGAIQAGRREQVRRQPWQQKRRIGTGLRDAPARVSRSALRW